METTTDRSTLEGKFIPELQRIAQDLGIEGTQRLRKSGLIDAIVAQAGGNGDSGNGGTPAGRARVACRHQEGRRRSRDRGRGARTCRDRRGGTQRRRRTATSPASNKGSTTGPAVPMTGPTTAATSAPTSAEVERRDGRGQDHRGRMDATATRTPRVRAATRDVSAPHARSVAGCARSAGSARSKSAPRRSRTRRSRPASSTCCPTATGSCGPPATRPAPKTSMCRSRRSARWRCARATC